MERIGEILLYLREWNTISVIVRLTIAMLCGGLIGLERASKRRAAGFRTYMVVCLGATLAMLLNQYIDHMLVNVWQISQTTDAARLGAQVINGIGFLGAGTILVTRRQEVKGLTTAAGLWA
jgi:putative Mg2+ transporter-C (MgtC) family protein